MKTITPWHTRSALILVLFTLTFVPAITSASTIWRSAPTHADEVLIYTPGGDYSWYNHSASSSIIPVGTWNNPDFVTDASTTIHVWARWNGQVSPILDFIAAMVFSGTEPYDGNQNIISHAAGDVTRVTVDTTTTEEELVLPAMPGMAIRTGQTAWLWSYPSWASYGADMWLGSLGNLPYVEICEGPCDQPGAPTIANLYQYREDGTTTVSAGSSFIGNSVVLAADLADPYANAAALQVELKPIDQPFDGANLYTSATTTASGSSLSTTTMSVSINNLITPTSTVPENGIQQSFHWRARVIDAQGATSTWMLYGASPNATDFTATYTLGQAAADSAKQVLSKDNYLWGGKGWDLLDKDFVPSGVVNSGYHYWNPNSKQVSVGQGVDCSGLVAWSYDHSLNPANSFSQNLIKYESADSQYRYNTIPVSRSQLQPGDVLFFDWNGDGRIDHVAEYVGTHNGYDVIHAAQKNIGIVTTTVNQLTDFAGNTGKVFFAHPKPATIAMSIKAHSPIHLSVTDPSGNIITNDSVIPSDEEYIRESGDLFYTVDRMDANGYPEDMVYSPVIKRGVYKIMVTPVVSSTLDQTYSLDFSAGSTTIGLAHNVPLRLIPKNGYRVIVDGNGVPMLDTTPPEASALFSTSTQKIVITGTDDLTPVSIATTSSSIMISDLVGNTLTLNIAQNIGQSNYASLVIPSFVYSSGTTTSATTSLRYFWTTDKTGRYTLFISAIRTPTSRQIAIYTSLTGKTYVVTSTSADDAAELSLQSALLLLRQKLKTCTGLVIPSIVTNKGSVVINY